MNSTNVKRLISLLAPPIVVNLISKIINRNKKISFTGSYSSWEAALNESSGYQEHLILEKVLSSTLKVQSGEAVFERDSVLFDEIQYSWPLLSGLLWIAARNNGKLNILDFGGSLGSSYFQNRKFLENFDISWNIVEQEHYVKTGKEHLTEKKLNFYSSIECYIEENSPDIILISGTLQYLQTPIELLNTISNLGAKLLIIDRTPVASISHNILTVQHVPKTIYPASYPMWIFSKNQLDLLLTRHWNLISRTLAIDGYHYTSTGLKISFECLILESER